MSFLKLILCVFLLEEPPEDHSVLDIDPRNRVAQNATLVTRRMNALKRTKRQADNENRELILKITICASQPLLLVYPSSGCDLECQVKVERRNLITRENVVWLENLVAMVP
ncbi:hypothetical protein TNCV_160921 [Trichonephila clavipes]|nr:hypothetical protein TNCV_160921 [Trichonephila clavipes]